MTRTENDIAKSASELEWKRKVIPLPAVFLLIGILAVLFLFFGLPALEIISK